ncbi:cytochrome c oxidase subunit II [Carboxylicivirga taeanensis]|uniref:cytochrome c oxidase subunit II n=1 Tax=Carboxylicivirga taeanensis TaxID=1416875 RepID=UPI003F6E3833
MYEQSTNNASSFVSQVDSAFVFIFSISLLFLVGITAFMIYYIIRYRKSKNAEATHIEGSNKLEIIWTIIPTILVVSMFYYGWSGWKFQRDIPEDAIPIKTIARMWSFTFQYENGLITDTLFVPKDQAVNLDLVALDVLHSLYIPAFRVKQDMVPGKQTNIWFESGREGEYEIFCAEYCGLRHSYMKSVVKVIPSSEFEALTRIDSTALVNNNAIVDTRQTGSSITRKYGCNACHTADGTKLVGPSYKNIMGRTRTVLIDGEEHEVKADEDYIRRSIYEPNVEVVKGYEKGLMLSYKDQVSEEEFQQLLDYFKYLSGQ